MKHFATLVLGLRMVLLPILLFGSLLAPGAIHAQGMASNWPPIPPAELALDDNPASRGSHAMILFRETTVDDPHSFAAEYVRIKVFDDEGKQYADVELPYDEKTEQIADLRARTVHRDGTVLDFHGEIYDRVVAKAKKLKYFAKVFTLPGVEKGSIIEYAYRIHWHVKIPEAFKDPSSYIATKGTFSLRTGSWDVQQDLYTALARFSFRPYPKAKLRWTTVGLGHNEPQMKSDGTVHLEVTNFPAFQEEDLMPPESALRGRVDFFYIFGNFGSAQSFWSEVGSRRSEELEEFLSKHKKVDQVMAETVAANDPSEVKLRKLYVRAQLIRSLSYEHRRTEKEEKQEHLSENKSVDDILEHGYARSNEINYLFVALARASGFDAHIVMVSSRNRGVFFSSLLDPGQLDAMVVAVGLGVREVYVDPATLLCPYPLLPWMEAGAEGITLGKFGGVLVRTPSPLSDDTLFDRKARLHVDNEGILRGQLSVAFTGQAALARRLAMNQEDPAGRRKGLEDEVKDWLPAGAGIEMSSSSGWETSEEPLRVEFNVSFPNVVVKTAHRMMLPLTVLVARKRSAFQSQFRLHPVYLEYPYQENDEIAIEIPNGYRVEALPAPVKKHSPAASYEISSVQQNNSIVLKRHFVLEGLFYEAGYYSMFRQFFHEVNSGDESRVVLKKVDQVGSQ